MVYPIAIKMVKKKKNLVFKTHKLVAVIFNITAEEAHTQQLSTTRI